MKREYILFLLHDKSNYLYKAYNLLLKYRLHKLGFSIPTNVVVQDWGLILGGVAINGNAKIGSNCHIFGDVTIGVKDNLGSKAPQIGDNVTIGASARIIEPIKIASNCIIGANAVVTHSVLEERKTIVGIPGRVLKKKSFWLVKP